jgi:aminodeoxyfutalosine deaminase
MNDLNADDLTSIPKIDLHRHLLGSARADTLLQLAELHHLGWANQPVRNLRNAIAHGRPQRSLRDYVAPWRVFREAVQTPEDIRRIAAEAATDAYRDGVRYVEFRSALPGMPITDGDAPQTRIPPDEYLSAIAEGFSEVPNIACRILASVTRHAFESVGPRLMSEFADQFIQTIERFRGRLVVGVDLSGVERGFPAKMFKPIFDEARSVHLPVTVHAGETEGPSEIWSAIDDLGACRVGHGTSFFADPALARELISRGIVLEVCPTASWLVGITRDLSHQPVIESEPAVPYVICTDNPTLNSTTQSNELRIAARIAGKAESGYAAWQFRVASRAAFSPTALAAAGITLDT